jgi:hypothetical protein
MALLSSKPLEFDPEEKIAYAYSNSGAEPIRARALLVANIRKIQC